MDSLLLKLGFMTFEKNLLDEQQIESVSVLGSAMSSGTRIRMLRELFEKNLTISQLADKLDVSVSSATFHLKLLKDADLIDISYLPSKKGKIQLCMLKYNIIRLFMSKDLPESHNVYTVSMPVGLYVDGRFDFVSGFCTGEKQVMFDDGNFFNPERVKAGLLWCKSGYVVYAFSNTVKGRHIAELSLSLEICSEIISYRNDWKSDITFSLNGEELCTYTSPGDFGGRPGLLNPSWWACQEYCTQYGQLKRITVNSEGVFLDGQSVNKKVTIDKLKPDDLDTFYFRIENKPDAEHVGGFNLFGRNFGDYTQDIVLQIALK
jgi:predicted transcriptional regulator